MKKILIISALLITASCGHEDDATSDCNSNEALVMEEGAQLFAANCAKCHGPIATTKKRNKTAEQITAALKKIKKMQSIRLTPEQIEKIVAALKD